MSNQYTFGRIKPDILKRNMAMSMLHDIEQNGFNIIHIQTLNINVEREKIFYEEHKNAVFFDRILNYMVLGNTIGFILKGENTVERFRDFIGYKDPHQATVGTLRNKYGISLDENSIHGSVNAQEALREITVCFPYINLQTITDNNSSNNSSSSSS